MASEMDKEDIEKHQHSKSMNKLWLMLKEATTTAVNMYIPVKMCKSREQLPYITTEISKFIKKRNDIQEEATCKT